MQYQKKLDDIERRFEELTAQMADNAVISDSTLYRKISKQQSDMSDMVGKYREWKEANKNLQEARPMLEDPDPELRAMAQEEVARLEPLLAQYEEELKVLMLPKDPLDEKDVVLGNLIEEHPRWQELLNIGTHRQDDYILANDRRTA